MKIPADLLKKWKSLKKFGDVQKIIDDNPHLLELFTRGTLQNKVKAAFDGESDIDVVSAMKRFYEARQKQIDEVLK